MLRAVRNVAQKFGVIIYREPNAYHLAVEYPVSDKPRYGYKTPPHQLIKSILESHRQLFESFLRSLPELEPIIRDIPYEAGEPALPHWNNGWFPPRDAAALIHFITTEKPSNFLEIGSGNSTKFARLAVDRDSPATRITSIDPQPREEVNDLCDEIVRHALEDVDLAVFDRLRPGDILSFDGSHRCFTDSDVTVFFLEVLPRVPAGVLVHVHDIFWPLDYPPHWGRRFYSEQYLLGQLLLLAGDKIDILVANAFIDQDPDLRALARASLPVDYSRVPVFGGLDGVGFWFRIGTAL